MVRIRSAFWTSILQTARTQIYQTHTICRICGICRVEYVVGISRFGSGGPCRQSKLGPCSRENQQLRSCVRPNEHSRRRAEPDSAKIFPDLRPGASSTPCSHHLIPCQKYREFRPDPIDSAALYGVKPGERSRFFRKVPVVFPDSRDFRGGRPVP
jgi:hypothetical protein